MATETRALYRVEVYQGSNQSRYYAATVREARMWLAETFGRDAKIDTKITRITVSTSRQGIAAELNTIIADYCLNEH